MQDVREHGQIMHREYRARIGISETTKVSVPTDTSFAPSFNQHFHVEVLKRPMKSQNRWRSACPLPEKITDLVTG